MDSHRLPVVVIAVRASPADGALIANLLSRGPRPLRVTVAEARDMVASDPECFLLWQEALALGFVQLRAVDEGNRDAVGVVWIPCRRPVGIGAAALGFVLQRAFEEIGLREVWGWVADDNWRMLALCKRLGILDRSPWKGNPGQRLVACSRREYDAMRSQMNRLARWAQVMDNGGLR